MDCVQLCVFCSKINWEYLRVPTVGQLHLLSTGHDISGVRPFKREKLRLVDRTWALGSMDRILKCAVSCTLCDSISQLFNEINRSDPGRLAPGMGCSALLEPVFMDFRLADSSKIHPRVIEAMAVRKAEDVVFTLRAMTIEWWSEDTPSIRFVAYKCITAFDPENPAGTESVLEGRDTIRDGMLVLCGRKSSPTALTDLLRYWIDKCRSTHQNCALQSLQARKLSSQRCSDGPVCRGSSQLTYITLLAAWIGRRMYSASSMLRLGQYGGSRT